MVLLKQYFKEHWGQLFFFSICSVVLLYYFHAAALPFYAVVYPLIICTVFGALFFCAGYIQFVRRHRLRTLLQERLPEANDALPIPATQSDSDYLSVVSGLLAREQASGEDAKRQYEALMEYFTLWAHQIKTPIAAMRLQLQEKDTAENRELSDSLFQIEQYVNMVLCYLRLRSDSTDFLIRTFDLDTIIRQGLKRMAAQFIRKKLRLNYTGIHYQVLTDEKWLLFVIEQVLSNAIKYTPEGSISIAMPEPGCLTITDTGIGIAPEDLPRIFENGYTGYNGRMDKAASGIGLHLCRSIVGKLGHTIQAYSKPGVGTTITICLSREYREIE